MTKIIRKSAFETNSSSCHSLTFTNKGDDKLSLKAELKRLENQYPDKIIPVVLEGYCGGDVWLSSVEDKLSYIFSDFCPEDIRHNLNEIERRFPEDMHIEDLIRSFDSPFYIVRKGFNEEALKEFLKVEQVADFINWIKKKTGFDVRFEPGNAGWVGIDHESCGKGRGIYFLPEEKRYAFLFSTENKIWVEHDG